MTTWLPHIAGMLALAFTAFSFWWMNWRPGSLQVGGIAHFAAGRAPEKASEQPNVVVVTLPLILWNSGARPLVVETLRLVGTRDTTIGILSFEATDSHLEIVRPGENAERDYFYLPLALKANEIVKKNFVFQQRNTAFVFGNLLYHLHLEVKISGHRDWLKMRDVELDFRKDENGMKALGLNLVYQVFEYEARSQA